MKTNRDIIANDNALDRTRRVVPRLLLLMTIALVGASQTARSEEAAKPAAAAPVAVDRAVATRVQLAPSAQERKSFHEKMLTIPVPHRGCFEAHYPTATWTETPCVAAPKVPSPLVKGTAFPNTVGAGTDYFTSVSGHLSSATGSFDSATGITKEYGSKGNDLTTVYPDVYELQMNSNVYTAPCPSAGGCQGWEQFLFSQSQCGGACVFIEYWLLNYPSPCPTTEAWIYYPGSPTTTPGCYFNTNGKGLPAPVALADFGKLVMTASVSGGNDEVQLTDGDGNVYKQSNASVANLANGWSGAEYNVFGDCCASHIYFTGAPATVVVRQAVNNGTTNAPSCTSSFNGTTAETNNLNLTGGCTASGGAKPAIVFTETGGGTLPPGVSIGDPHFTTFQSSHYNFMEAGEYILVQAPNLTVQSRQALISAAGQPAIAQNIAMAVKMGSASVTVYPTSLVVNGNTVTLADTHAMSLGGGVVVARNRNLYTISRANGDIVQGRQIASSGPFPAHVDITVNLGGGTDPSKVSGLLVSNPTAPKPVVLRSGVALAALATVADLHTFADSWRIAPKESLFRAEGRPVVSGLVKPLTLDDLEAAKRTSARQICVDAGVTGDASLDDCTLDVGATGDKTLANAFVHVAEPKFVMAPR